MVKSLSALLPEIHGKHHTPPRVRIRDIKLLTTLPGWPANSAHALEKVQANLPPSFDPKARWMRPPKICSRVPISDDLAVVKLRIFSQPIIDSPYCSGRFSRQLPPRIYAMGAEPIFALTFRIPSTACRIPFMRNSAGCPGKGQKAGHIILGGHTVDDNEPKFRHGRIRLVAPVKVNRNSTPNPVNITLLTKPSAWNLTTALKQGLLVRN